MYGLEQPEPGFESTKPEPGFESKPEPGFDPTLIFTDPKRDFFFNSGLIFLLFLLVCQILGHFHPNLLWPNWEVRFDSANQDPGKKYRNWDEIRTESCKNIWLKATKPIHNVPYVIFRILVSLENVRKCILGGCTITSKGGLSNSKDLNLES